MLEAVPSKPRRLTTVDSDITSCNAAPEMCRYARNVCHPIGLHRCKFSTRSWLPEESEYPSGQATCRQLCRISLHGHCNTGMLLQKTTTWRDQFLTLPPGCLNHLALSFLFHTHSTSLSHHLDRHFGIVRHSGYCSRIFPAYDRIQSQVLFIMSLQLKRERSAEESQPSQASCSPTIPAMTTIMLPIVLTTSDTTTSHSNESNVPFILINLEDSGIDDVITLLRRVWTTLPTHPQTKTHTAALTDLIIENCINTPGKRDDLPQNPDVDTVHTQWRNAIYDYWGYIFHNVALFMPQLVWPHLCQRPESTALVTFGRWDPTRGNQQIAVSGVAGNAKRDMLMILTYLKPGMSFRTTIRAPRANNSSGKNLVDDSSSSDGSTRRPSRRQRGVWDGSNPYEMCYVKGGSKMKFEFSSDRKDEMVHLAAVMVCGALDSMNDGDYEERSIQCVRMAAMLEEATSKMDEKTQIESVAMLEEAMSKMDEKTDIESACEDFIEMEMFVHSEFLWAGWNL